MRKQRCCFQPSVSKLSPDSSQLESGRIRASIPAGQDGFASLHEVVFASADGRSAGMGGIFW